MMTLKDLKIGQSGTIQSVGGEGALRQHFLDMGMVPGVVVSVVKFAPMQAEKQKNEKNSTSRTW